MTRHTKPDSHQLNLALCSQTSVNLNQQGRTELAEALVDMLLQAVTATEKQAAPTEDGNESETHN
jgi:hypothetical protein